MYELITFRYNHINSSHSYFLSVTSHCDKKTKVHESIASHSSLNVTAYYMKTVPTILSLP